MNRKIALLLVVLMFTLSLSGCLRNGKGGSNDEPGVVYEPGMYDVLAYEDVVYADLHIRIQAQKHLLFRWSSMCTAQTAIQPTGRS